ncbi:MAG: 16S rRNA (cytosine(1402)-N(4))-methyltransferase RsmH [Candidatus Aureabacteria bacterium]|nr:16S rRNA (cytosine(1402)-N(4))-methyltransferase RsmH [Candidatus Auribacterota bacterium]
MNKELFSHRPVLLHEVACAFKDIKINYFIDGTLGSGGHAQEILQQHGEAFLIGFDMDKYMIKEAARRLAPFKKRFCIVNTNFSQLDNILNKNKIDSIDGFLLDLGVSSYQLDTPERGFSFRYDSPLDMRLDTGSQETAFDVINYQTKESIQNILIKYGEERDAKRLANAIVTYRMEKPISSTKELEKIIKKVKGNRHFKKNPCAKIFQAFRIFLNKELESLSSVLPLALKYLRVGGRIAVITFHSLEDRIVKNFFKERSNECICLKGMPVCTCNIKPDLKIITSRPIVPSSKEINDNPRSRSAKLRVAEKIR